MGKPFFEKLYKYINNEYAEKFFSSGLVRIGTLYDYRKNEIYGPQISDKDEGIKSTYINDDKMVWEKPEDVPEFARDIFNLESGLKVNLYGSGGNIRIVKKYVSPDCYIYCVSETFDKNMMRRLGYDTCIEINDPINFSIAFSKCLNKDIKNIHLGKCEYIQRDQYYTQATKTHPCF